MESVDPKNQRVAMTEEEGNEDRRSNKDAEGWHYSEPKKAHLTGEFVIVAKFGDHVLR